MPRLLASFGLYWHVLLDLILTHVYVIAFLNAGFASIAGLLMAMDAMFRATLMIFLSRLTVRFSSIARGRLSVLLRFSLIGIWLISVGQLPINSISLSVFLPFVLFKVISTADASLSSEFIFLLEEYFHVSLSQSAAAMNILVRSGTAIAPAVALLILTTRYASWAVSGLALVIGIVSTILLKEVFFSFRNAHHFKKREHVSLYVIMKNSLMRWGLFSQFLVNLAFSGVAFLFLAKLKLHGDVFFNEITVLYTAFFVVQFVVLIFGDTIVPGNKPIDMAWMIGLCALLILFSGLSDNYMRLFVCGLIGFVYSLMLSAGQKIITARLRGKGFVEYSSWAQMIGRLTSFAGTAVLGLMLGAGVSSSMLLLLCGGVGVLSAFLLGNMASGLIAVNSAKS